MRTLIYLVMVQLIGYMVSKCSWRDAFLFLVVPFASMGLASVFRVLPHVRRDVSIANANILEV